MKDKNVSAAHQEQDLEDYEQIALAILALHHAVDARHAIVISPIVRKQMIVERDRLYERQVELRSRLLATGPQKQAGA